MNYLDNVINFPLRGKFQQVQPTNFGTTEMKEDAMAPQDIQEQVAQVVEDLMDEYTFESHGLEFEVGKVAIDTESTEGELLLRVSFRKVPQEGCANL